MIAMPKPGKDPSSPKSYHPISLLCIPYKLYERLILMRISLVDEKLTKDQAGFRPGRSCAGQLLNLTQHIEDGYERKMLTDAASVDLSAAYDTVQHRLMIRKLMDMTGDIYLCQVIRGLLSNRRFIVQLNDKKSRWRSQKNGLPQGSVLAPLLFNIYTNDQPLPTDCSRLIYTDDICITTQQSDFQHVEQTLELALDEMSIHYSSNHLKPNPAKTQICCFHLRNRDAKRKLDVTWNGLELDHYPNPIYLGVTLDRTLSFKQHALNTKAKVNTRNNLPRKLTNSRWGAHPATVRTTALALCYSTAEYACSSWGRSRHTGHVGIALNDTCRIITGCLNATPIHCVYAPLPTYADRCLQEDDPRHPLHGQRPAKHRLPSRNSFLDSTEALNTSKQDARTTLWVKEWNALGERSTEWRDRGIIPNGHLANGTDEPWTTWRSLNRLRVQKGRCRAMMKMRKLSHTDLTRFNHIATQGAPQMAVDKEANSLSRVYSYYSKFILCLFYM